MCREGLNAAVGGDLFAPDVCALLGCVRSGREGHDPAGATGVLQDDACLFGLEVDDGRGCLVEDAQLALEVVLEAGVLARRDVVAPDVEEARDVQRQADHAVVLECLARDLHDHVAQAGARGVVDVAPQIGRLGRGVDALRVLDAVERVDGTHDCAVGLGLACVQNGAHHVGDGRLALGARDADDVKLPVGMPPCLGAGDCHRAAKPVVAHDQRGRVGGRRGKLGAVRLVA